MVKREEIKKEIGSIALSSIKKLQVKGIMGYTINRFSSIIGEDKIGNINSRFNYFDTKRIKKHR